MTIEGCRGGVSVILKKRRERGGKSNYFYNFALIKIFNAMPEKHDSSHIKVYTASAGSGKTYTLAAEYIACLLTPEKNTHRYVLAVTFTNKATGEMKERILQYLFALSKGGEQDFLKTLCRIRPEINNYDVCTLAREALEDILHDYDHFPVKTIDAFFQQLLSNLSHELGLSPRYRIDLGDDEVTREAVDDMLASLNDGALTTDERRLLKRVKRYIARRIEENDSWQLARDLTEFAKKNVLTRDYQRHEKAFVKLFDGADDEDTDEQMVRLRTLRNDLEPGGKVHSELLGQFEALLLRVEGFDRERWAGNGRSLLTALSHAATNPFYDFTEAQQKVLDSGGDFVKAAFRNDAALVEATKRILLEISEAREAAERAARLRNTVSLILRSMDQLRLLDHIARRMAHINAEADRFLLSNTKFVFNLLVTDSDAEFVFEKVGTQFHHVLIDEFQDTARMQWENMRKLLIEATAGGNDCLIVGDVKQSIYRWNGGDWSILQHIDKEIQHTAVEHETLDDNYRSEGHIVAFNNEFFKHAATLLDRIGGNEVISDIYGKGLHQNVTKRTDGGCVKVVSYYKKETTEDGDVCGGPFDEHEETGIVNQVRRLHQAGIAYSEMAILVRRNSDTQRVLEHFTRYGEDIPLISAQAFLLSSSIAVEMLINALKFLYDEKDTAAGAALAVTYYYIMCGELPQWEALQDSQPGLLPPDFEKRRSLLRRMPLYELLEQLIELFHFERFQDTEELRGQSSFVMSLLDEVLKWQQSNPSSIPAFLDFWDHKLHAVAIPMSKADGIQILTIHKAKGLAYHTVMIPFSDWTLDAETHAPGSENYLWCEGKAEGDGLLSMLPAFPVSLNSPSRVKASEFAEEYEAEKQQRRVDSINMAYVAYTRAKENLLVWAVASRPKTKKNKKDDSGEEAELKVSHFGDVVAAILQSPEVASHLPALSVVETSYGKMGEMGAVSLQKGGKENEKPELANPFKVHPADRPWTMRSYPAHVDFVQSNASQAFLDTLDEAEEEQDRYIKRGNLYHLILSKIHTPSDLLPALKEMAASGVIVREEARSIATFLTKRLRGKAAQWFSDDWEVNNECTLLFRDATGRSCRRRPDRVIERDGDVVVIDFKFAKPQTEHKAQVADYVKLLQAMKPHAAVTGFLWYVYPDEIIKV